MTPTPERPKKAALLFIGFLGCVVAANWLTNRYGFVPVGFGLMATAGTYAAGLSFGVRDALHEVAGRWVVIAGIVAGAGLSAFVSPTLALASGVAFLVAEFADLAVYEPLRRHRWVAAVIASNVVGAVVDTVVFLHLAGFPIRDAIAGQMVGKCLAILPALVIVWWVRRR
jgi:uncharacterized PurR-regulated membrane protein YhhQ (DUF165 family)